MIWAVSTLIFIGSFLMLASAIGIIKFPDIYTRMHATTKASSLAIVFLVLAAAIYYAPELNFRATCIIVFIFLTSPIGAHLVARSAHLDKIPLWDKSKFDDYDSNGGSTQKNQTVKESSSQEVKTKKAPTSKKAGNTKISEIFKNLKDKPI